MRTETRAGLYLLAAALLAPAEPGWSQSSASLVPPKAVLAIGVAPFERVAAPGASVPDVAALLADRLGTKGVERVVGPSKLGARAVTEPSPEEIQEWAARTEVAVIVVGRTTRLGRSLSLDVRLRTAGDGGVLGTFVEEVDRPGDLGNAIDRLADQVLKGASGPPPVSSAAGGSGEKKPPSVFRSDAPIKIRSAQLEAFEKDGRKHFVFTDDVHASQADFELRSERLEAFYPVDSSQPDRLVATGNVVLVQQDRMARCERATYFRADQRVVCTGKEATLTRDEDRVRGREIIFHLDSERLTVQGGASVSIHPGNNDESDAGEVATDHAAP